MQFKKKYHEDKIMSLLLLGMKIPINVDKKAGLITRIWNICNNHAGLNLVLPRISNNFAKPFNLNLVVALCHVKCTPAYAVLSFPQSI